MRMTIRAVVSSAFLVTLAGCEPIPGSGSQKIEFSSPDEAFEHFFEPQYGEDQFISGEFSWYFETSAIELCDNRNDCIPHRNVDGTVQSCWVDFVKDAGKDRRLAEAKDGSFWLEGRGRVAVLPGSFGHLGEYTCQIEMSRIDRLESKRGLYEPLPPSESDQ